jgi:hypothetical protein
MMRRSEGSRRRPRRASEGGASGDALRRRSIDALRLECGVGRYSTSRAPGGGGFEVAQTHPGQRVTHTPAACDAPGQAEARPSAYLMQASTTVESTAKDCVSVLWLQTVWVVYFG